MLPNKRWQADTSFWGLVNWLFSVPVFTDSTLEIPLSMYSRLLNEAYHVELTNQPLHLNDVLVYVPFLDLMSTYYKQVKYDNGVLSSANKLSENELGRISMSFKPVEIHATRISLSFPILLLLFFGYFLTMYILFWAPLNGIAFLANACLTKRQA